jgi:nucleoside 2-deoxyribosyltransferase
MFVRISFCFPVTIVGDVKTADIIIANLIGTEKASIGTVMEIAWADLQRTPVIAIMEPEGNPHEHAMLSECISYRVETLDEALEVAKKILVC